MALRTVATMPSTPTTADGDAGSGDGRVEHLDGSADDGAGDDRRPRRRRARPWSRRRPRPMAVLLDGQRRRRQRRTRLTPATVSDQRGADHAGEGQLLAALGRDHRPPARLGALDERLLVGDRRPPAVGLQAVVGDEPRLAGVTAQPGRDRAPLEPPAQRADHLGEAVGQRDPRPCPAERTHPLARHPTVGRDVEDAVEALVDGQRDGRGEVVEVEELGRRVVLAEALPEPGGEGGGERRRAVGGHRHDRAQHGGRACRAPPGARRRPSPRPSPAGGRRRTRRRGGGWRPR